MAGQHPVYGLHTGLRSSDDWWRMLIDRCLSKCLVDRATVEHVIGPLADALLRRFETAEAYELAEGVMPALRAISNLHQQQSTSSTTNQRFVRMSLATNSDHRILSACKDLGLGSLLDLDVRPDTTRAPTEIDSRSPRRLPVDGPTLSYDVGYEKPDQRFFHAVVKRAFPESNADDFEVHCRQTLYVGDHFHEDFLGARRAGLQAAWLRRQQPLPSAEEDLALVRQARSDNVVLDSMSEVATLIETSWHEEEV